MKHETWIGPLRPERWNEEDGTVVQHHYLSQVHGNKVAAFKYIMSLEAVEDRKAQVFMLLGARRDLRAFIAEQGDE